VCYVGGIIAKAHNENRFHHVREAVENVNGEKAAAWMSVGGVFISLP